MRVNCVDIFAQKRQVSYQDRPCIADRLNCILLCHLQYTQGDYLSGKPGNVREFDSCQRNVRDFTKSQGNVREKYCQGKVA